VVPGEELAMIEDVVDTKNAQFVISSKWPAREELFSRKEVAECWQRLSPTA
jgi:hypothetical protein